MAALDITVSVIQTLGGLGIFLVGMIVMTGALKSLAGSALRQLLMRFTRTPVSGAMTGAACTAILQSSSATTVAAVGFVGAGLMTFPSALGIVFGAIALPSLWEDASGDGKHQSGRLGNLCVDLLDKKICLIAISYQMT